ncbi:MAG: hypothetical protein HZA89_01130 [Verrucomicrobia bacterium]|nr:hypothetical protein [Verrucomicrobiota bacterium]
MKRLCLLALCLSALAVSLPLHAAKIVLVAGGGTDAVNIPATEAKLKEPFGVDFDKSGTMFIIEMVSGNRLLKVDAKGILSRVTASSIVLDGGGNAPAPMQFNGPHNLAVLPDGNVLVADTWNGRVLQVDAKSGGAFTIPGFIVLPEIARSSGPYCITLDFTGKKLFIADLQRIHVVDLATGKAKIVAGNGKKGKPPDGALAVEAPLSDPRAVAPDRKGNIYILERGGNALRVVDAAGKIRTVVNASGAKGGDGDGGDALAATMNGPKHLCVDKEDNVVIADAESHLVRKYIPSTGKIVRVAGTGKKGAAGVGGDPLKCELARPHGVVVHLKTGELYITDSYNNRILKIVR